MQKMTLRMFFDKAQRTAVIGQAVRVFLLQDLACFWLTTAFAGGLLDLNKPKIVSLDSAIVLFDFMGM